MVPHPLLHVDGDALKLVIAAAVLQFGEGVGVVSASKVGEGGVGVGAKAQVIYLEI